MSSTRLVSRPKSRFARYGPSDRYESPPPAGMCISVFAVVRSKGKKKKGVLLGLPRPDNRWPTEWITAWRTYPERDLSRAYQQWRLPSVYLAEGEHPDEALGRIMRDQLQIQDYTVENSESPHVLSYWYPSDWYPGNNHWDLVFVYDVKVRAKDLPSKGDLPHWWQEISFAKKKKDFRDKDYGGNADLMVDLGLLEEIAEVAMDEKDDDGVERKERKETEKKSKLEKKKKKKSRGEDEDEKQMNDEEVVAREHLGTGADEDEDGEPEGRIITGDGGEEDDEDIPQ